MISWEKVSWGWGLQVPWSVHFCRAWRPGWAQPEPPELELSLSAVVWAGCWWAPVLWSRTVPVSSGGLLCAEAVGSTGEPFPAQLDHSHWPHGLHMTKHWCNSGHSSSSALGSFTKIQACLTDVLQHIFLTAPMPAPLAFIQGQAFAGRTLFRSLSEFLIYLLCVLWKVSLQHSGTVVQLCKSSFSLSERTEWNLQGYLFVFWQCLANA